MCAYGFTEIRRYICLIARREASLGKAAGNVAVFGPRANVGADEEAGTWPRNTRQLHAAPANQFLLVRKSC
jgi:hypothetical protein